MKLIANNYSSSEIIRIIREWTELSQKEFAKRTNRSQRTVQSYELGIRNCKLETLIQIANEFGITTHKERKMQETSNLY